MKAMRIWLNRAGRREGPLLKEGCRVQIARDESHEDVCSI